FHGLVFDEDAMGKLHIFARHVIKSTVPAPIILQLSYPIGAELSQHLSHTTGLHVAPGQALLSVYRLPNGELDFDSATDVELSLSEKGGAAKLTQKRSGRSMEQALSGFPILMSATDWQTGKQMQSDVLSVDFSL